MAKFGLVPAPTWSEVVPKECRIILIAFYYTLVLWNFALKCFLREKGAQDGQVWTGAGSHVVRGGPHWVQNHPYNF